MLSDAELTSLRQGLAEGGEPLRLILHLGADESELGSQLSDLAEQLVRELPDRFAIERAPNADLPALPAMTIARGERRSVRYLALPSGHQAAPFIEAAVRLARGAEAPAEEWAKPLGNLPAPAELQVFVAPTCPHCPLAVRAATQLAADFAAIRATVVDVQRFPELSQRFSVQSVPLTVLDGGMSWTGPVTARQLAEQIAARGSSEHDAQAFVSLVETGRVSDAAREILAGRGAPHFLAAWQSSATSLRMGLLLAVEEALEEDPACLDGIVPELVKVLEVDDAALQGDTADLLGQIGRAEAADALRALRDHPNPDVAEIAAEAVGEIESRQR